MSTPAAQPGIGVIADASRVAEPSGLWGRAFRPFFLGLAVYATLAVPAWAAIWLGSLRPPMWSTPMAWHGHEMIFGFVAAAIAGFLLTASAVWSGGPALCGRPLKGLFALWVAGRLAMAAAGFVPAVWIAAIDLAFLPAVALGVVRTLWGSGQWRNYAIVGVLAILAIANASMHADVLGFVAGVAGRALRFAVDAVIVLILVISGRITPAFTRNAFRNTGRSHLVRSSPGLDRLVVVLAVASMLSGALLPATSTTGVLGLATAAVVAIRFAGWLPWHTRSDALLWSLHAGSAWLVVGLALCAASDLGAPVPPASGLHALTAGAMGTFILAVVTRVGLGHTGRPLVLPRGVVFAHLLIGAGALLRVAAPFFARTPQREMLVAGALLWASAFGLFAIRYAAILVSPRPDGRPG